MSRQNQAVINFAKAFYCPSTIENKIKAAYEFSIIYDQIGNGPYSRIMEIIGNHYYSEKIKARVMSAK